MNFLLILLSIQWLFMVYESSAPSPPLLVLASSFIFVVYNRAIVLEPGNPSMKSQIKALAAVEGNFSFVSSTLWMNFSCNIWSVKVPNSYCHWDEQLEIFSWYWACYLLIITLFSLPKLSRFTVFSLIMFILNYFNE